jgi:hypothetical protein
MTAAEKDKILGEILEYNHRLIKIASEQDKEILRLREKVDELETLNSKYHRLLFEVPTKGEISE